jgi:Glycosyltransferase family 87
LARDGRTLAAGALCLAGIVLVVAAAHNTPVASASPLRPTGAWRPLLWIGLVGAVACYAAACWTSARGRPSLAAVGAIAVAIQIAPLFGPLLLSRDAIAYVIYGREHQPYTNAGPNMTPDVYGPLWTFISQPLAHLSHPVLAFRLLAAAAALALTAAAALLAANSAAAVVFVGWNPLLALHAAGSGHNDAVMMAFVLLALLLARSRRAQAAGVAWAAAVWIKWVPLVFWAAWLAWRRRRAHPLGLTGFVAASAVLAAAAFARFGTGWLHLARTASEEARRTSSLGLLEWLGDLGASHRAAVAVSGLAALAVATILIYRAARGRLSLGAGGSFLALTQGRLNPWYGIWGIGLAGADEQRTGRVAAVALTALLLSDALPR